MPSGAVLPRLSIDTDLPSMSASNFVTPASSPTMPSPLISGGPLGSPPSVGRRRLDAFNISCLIGKGGFGKVFMVTHKATSAVYAMKVMEKEALVRRKAVGDAHAERNILAMVGETEAPFIVRLHVAFQTARRVYLVMDFASGGELMFHLRREAMLSEDDARFYAAELLLALESLHGMGVVHRDIKPENVLLDSAGHLVLTDFGLAKELDDSGEQAHSWCGSEDYMAPEIIARKSHAGKPADYWAYGVFIYDCLCGQPPFSPLHEKGKLSRKRLHERILKCKYRLPHYLSRECHSLLRALLTKDPVKRLVDPAAIRAHPWFANTDWEALRNKKIVPPIVPAASSPTACFSPSLTKVDWSAPHSPVSLGAAAVPLPTAASASMPVNVPGASAAAAEAEDKLWQGFSFVAPGMEMHFALTPAAGVSAVVPPAGAPGSAGAAAAAVAGMSLALPCGSPGGGVGLVGSDEGVPWVDGASGEGGLLGSSLLQSPCETEVWHDALAAEVAEFSVEAKEAVEIERGDIK